MSTTYHYFAYGSNMSSPRLLGRVPVVRAIGRATLLGHELRFHKRGRDGSGKCDAFETGSLEGRVCGVLFELPLEAKPELDRHEGLGKGYDQKEVELLTAGDEPVTALTYYATHIDAGLAPYHWYKHHVLAGAREHGLPESYIRAIEIIASVGDPVAARHRREMSIHANHPPDKRIESSREQLTRVFGPPLGG